MAGLSSWRIATDCTRTRRTQNLQTVAHQGKANPRNWRPEQFWLLAMQIHANEAIQVAVRWLQVTVTNKIEVTVKLESPQVVSSNCASKLISLQRLAVYCGCHACYRAAQASPSQRCRQLHIKARRTHATGDLNSSGCWQCKFTQTR